MKQIVIDYFTQEVKVTAEIAQLYIYIYILLYVVHGTYYKVCNIHVYN